MKIAFIANNTYAPWGGSEELWSLAALRLRASGKSVLTCTQNWDPPPKRITELSNAGVLIRTIKPKRFNRIREKMHVALHGGSTRSLQRMMIDEVVVPFQPDLVVISQMMNHDGAHWASACQQRHLRYALISQAADACSWPQNWIFSHARASHQHAWRSFFVSRHNLELTIRQIGLSLPQAEIVSNPFNLSYHQSATWPTSDALRLACVARLEPVAKGQDVLLQVLAQSKWKARPIKLSLFGTGLNSASFPSLIEHLGLQGCVTLAGHTNDLAEVWRDHHALILPSRLEGTPLSLIEAMLCHRMAIVTDVGGNAELIEDGKSGFVATTPTVAAVEDALERAWTQRSDWRELGLAAGRRVRMVVPSDPAECFSERLLAIAREET